MLEHVGEEELLLAERVDRRGDRHEREEEAERRRRGAARRDRRPARGERVRAAVVEERGGRDQEQLRRVPRPARQRGRAHPGECRPALVVDSRSWGEHTYEAAGVSLATAGAVVERLRAAVESTGAERVRRLRGALPARRPAAAGRLHGLDRDEADARPRARPAARLRRRHRRALHQRRAHDRRRAAVPARLRRRRPARPRAGRRARRGRRGGVSRRGLRARRRRDGGAAGRLSRGRARLRRDVRRDRRPARPDRRLARRGGRPDRRLPVGRRARERLLARPAACSSSRTTTATTCSRRRGSTSTTSGRCGRDADVRALAHVTGGGIEGNLSRVLPEGLRAEIDWDAWERPPVFQWLARHVAEEELRRVFNLGIGYCAVVARAGRDGTVIGRRSRDRRARLRGGHEPAGADRRRPADLGGRVEPAGGAGARAGERGRDPDRASSSSTTTARRATWRWRLARGARRRARRPRRLHAAADAGRSSTASRPDRQRPPVPPALVPGLHAIEQALAAGVHTSGVTVHLVDEGMDTGPVLRQEPVPGRAARRRSIERIHAVEHRLLPEVVRELCAR